MICAHFWATFLNIFLYLFNQNITNINFIELFMAQINFLDDIHIFLQRDLMNYFLKH
jgi:hypothetical protein